MKTRDRQRGLTAIGMLSVLIVIGFLATCVIKLLPHYMDSWTLNGIISDSIEKKEYNNLSPGQIRRKVGKYLTVNRIDALTSKDIEIKRTKGKVFIDATYEKRVDFMFNIDVVMKFDKLTYEFDAK